MYLEAPTFEIHTINDINQFKELQQYFDSTNPELLILDVESDSTNERTAKLWGIGLCIRDNEAFYIPWRDKMGASVWSSNELLSIVSWLRQFLQKVKIVGHNVIYDALVIQNNLNIDIVSNIYSDTLLQKHTLAEESPFALKVIAKTYLGEWADKAQEALYANIEANGGKTNKDSVEMFKADTNVLAEYCCWDVLLTFKLFTLFEKKLKEENLYDLFYIEEIMPLYKSCTINMKRRGFPVDVKYFENLKVQVQGEIDKLESEIMQEIQPEISEFIQETLDKEFPVKNTGNFPKAYAAMCNVPLPINAKTGEITLAKKAVEQQKINTPQHADFYDWILGNNSPIPMYLNSTLASHLYGTCRQAQEQMFFTKYPTEKYIFNLRSNDHLIYLMFNALSYIPTEHTEKGKPKIDDDFFENAAKDGAYPFINKLLDFKKLNKLLSTYIEGILERQINGIIYTSMLQFGTTSGRYSSRDPNLQNIPRLKDDESGLSALVLKYTNAIKCGFVAPRGYKIVNADYSSLEPVCFAHVSNEEKLRNVFRNNEDLYSSVAINVFKISGCSAKKKDANYLKNIHPELRQQAKTFCLAVVYGAEASRISEIMNLPYKDAAIIIKQYLSTYPELRRYMAKCDYEAKKFGCVKTQFGRVRHLQPAQSIYNLYGDEVLDYKTAQRKNLIAVRREYKNLLNNSKNFKIQGLAAHIVNRAMIAIEKRFKEEGLDAYICVQVHDEITCICREDQAELCKSIVRECMEQTTVISVPLKAEPLIADNWADAK